MRKPPKNSMYLKKNCEEGCLYFQILDRRSRVLATSRIFRNEAWYAIGYELMMDVLDAELGFFEEWKTILGADLRGFSGILIRQNEDNEHFRFEYITNAGRKLLTSINFPSCQQAENAARQLRDIVRSIASEETGEFFPTVLE